MASKSSSRVLRFLRDPANRTPVVAFAVVTLVFLLSVANLLVVALDRVEVEPQEHPEVAWSMGRDAEGHDVRPRLEWGFTVRPSGHRVVDLDVGLPYEVSVAHYEGQALFSSLLTAYVDGERVGSVSRSVSALPGDAGESWTHSEDLGEALGRLSIERGSNDPPFVVLLVMDWSRTQQDSQSTRFDIMVGPAGVEPAGLPAIPACTGMDCARGLVVAAAVGQGAVGFWMMHRFHDQKGGGESPDRRRRGRAEGPSPEVDRSVQPSRGPRVQSGRGGLSRPRGTDKEK